MIYAINKHTKEHRVCSPEYSNNMLHGAFKIYQGERTVEADADGFIKHDGGECPLPADARYEIKNRDGEWGEGVIGKWAHGSSKESFDITHYRPILEDKEQDVSEQEWKRGDFAIIADEGRELDYGHRAIGEEVEVKAIFMSGDVPVAAVEHEGLCYCFRQSMLRPLRTAAQRAEDEAVEAIEQHAIELRPAYCRKLYHAIRDGRIPGVKLEGE